MTDNSGGKQNAPISAERNGDTTKQPETSCHVDDPMGTDEVFQESNLLSEGKTVSKNYDTNPISEQVRSNLTQKSPNVASEKYTFSLSDPAPFVVHIESTAKTIHGSINAIKVGSIILTEHQELDNKINKISPIGRNRIKVEFSTYIAANALINSSKLQKHSLDAFIPKFVLFRKGIVKFISKDLPNEYIKANIKPFDRCKFLVEEVTRIKRRANENEINKLKLPPDALLDTQSIIVSFRCSSLPKYILINKVRCEVVPYVQRVLLCFRCYRYGHMGKQCKSAPRCVKCAGDHSEQSCEQNVTSCIHCHGNHLANQLKLCPEFVRQKEIKNMMSLENISFYEASTKVPKKTYAKALNDSVSKTLASSSYIQIPKQIPINKPLPQPASVPINIASTSHKIKTNKNYPSQPCIGSKRTRPSYPANETLWAHKEIIATCPIPSSSGVALQCSADKEEAPKKSDDTVAYSLDGITKIILEVVKSVIDSLHINKEFKIDYSGLSS